MRTIKHFMSVMDLQTLIVSLLALASTYACEYFGLVADIPTSLIGLAVVFPIVFSINTAYKRREEGLKYYSGLKGHVVALYYAHRDWVPGKGGESEHCSRVRAIIEDLFCALHSDLKSDGGRTAERFHGVYAAFSRLSISHEELREAGVSGSEISRASQYLSKMMVEFEKMRNIAMYRTPVSLRAYSSIFLTIFPIAFGPYFASLNAKNAALPYVGFLVAVLYSLVLVTLDNIQEDLEDPFDDVGADDIELDVRELYKPVIAA